jgi:hypothetical protein
MFEVDIFVKMIFFCFLKGVATLACTTDVKGTVACDGLFGHSIMPSDLGSELFWDLVKNLPR